MNRNCLRIRPMIIKVFHFVSFLSKMVKDHLNATLGCQNFGQTLNQPFCNIYLFHISFNLFMERCPSAKAVFQRVLFFLGAVLGSGVG